MGSLTAASRALLVCLKISSSVNAPETISSSFKGRRPLTTRAGFSLPVFCAEVAGRRGFRRSTPGSWRCGDCESAGYPSSPVSERVSGTSTALRLGGLTVVVVLVRLMVRLMRATADCGFRTLCVGSASDRGESSAEDSWSIRLVVSFAAVLLLMLP
jgi:hypothetical protein